VEQIRTIEVPEEEAKKLQNFLKSRGNGTSTVLKVFVADFGYEIKANIAVHDGDPPFISADLFQDGRFLSGLEQKYTLVGDYLFYAFHEDRYRVVIKEL